MTEISRSETSGTIYNLCRDADNVSLHSVLILCRILHVETMFGNEGEGFLHACISSSIFNSVLSSVLQYFSSVLQYFSWVLQYLIHQHANFALHVLTQYSKFGNVIRNIQNKLGKSALKSDLKSTVSRSRDILISLWPQIPTMTCSQIHPSVFQFSFLLHTQMYDYKIYTEYIHIFR